MAPIQFCNCSASSVRQHA